MLQSATECYRVLQSVTKTNLAHLLGPIFGLVFYSFPYILSISYAFSLSIQLEFSSYFWISIHHMECPEGPNIPIIRPPPFTQKLLSISSEYRPQRRFNQVAHTFKRVFLRKVLWEPDDKFPVKIPPWDSCLKISLFPPPFPSISLWARICQ